MDIRNRFTGEIIVTIEKLEGAYLRGAYLRGAYLRGAYLRGAYLEGAYLRGVEGLFPDLYCLKQMPQNTKLCLYKYITANNKSPISKNKIKYEVGKIYKEKDYETDERINCGKGLSLATLQWCLNEMSDNNKLIECEFRVKDIVAIPFATDGKIRVKKLKVIRELSKEEAENDKI